MRRHAATGWSVIGVGVAIFLVLYASIEEPGSSARWLLALVAAGMVLYGLVLVFRRPKPKVEVSAGLVAAGQWRNQDNTAYQVEVEVTVDWDQPVQIRFTLQLGDGRTIDNDTYHREYLEGRAPQGFLDNPKVCEPGKTGPFKIAFLIPTEQVLPEGPPSDNLALVCESVLPGLVNQRVPVVVLPRS